MVRKYSCFILAIFLILMVLNTVAFGDSFVKSLPLTNATVYDPAVDYFVLKGSAMGGTTGFIEPENGYIYHNAAIAACAASSWGWAKVGIDVQDGVFSDNFTVNQSGIYKLVLSGKLNGGVIEGSTAISAGIGKTTGSLYIAGRLGGENSTDYSIYNLHKVQDDLIDFLNDSIVSSAKNIISTFVPGVGSAIVNLYDVLIALDKSKEWDNETFQIISYNYLEAGKNYRWSFYVRSVQGSAQAIGGSGAALYEMEVSNLTADLYYTGESAIHTVLAAADSNGIITPSGNISVGDGQEINFRAVPNQGYLVDRWYVDSQDVGGYTSGLLIPHVYKDRTVTVTFRPMPDLEITDLHPEPSPTNNVFKVGQQVSWFVTTRNNGGSAEASRVSYYLAETPGDLSNYIIDDSIIALNNGAEETVYNDYTFTASDIGQKYLLCIADYKGDVDESNEENNYEVYGPFNVVAEGGVTEFTASDGDYPDKVVLQWPAFGSQGSFDVYGYSLYRDGEALVSSPNTLNTLSPATTSYVDDVNVEQGVVYKYTLGVNRSEGGKLVGTHLISFHTDTGFATPPSLSYITISGSSEVVGGTDSYYSCRAYFSDGNSLDITDNANWSVSSDYGSFRDYPVGLLYVKPVTSDQTCTITATYEGEIDTHEVLIKVYNNILDGWGTKEAPYLIKSLQDFDLFANNPNYWEGWSYARLETDIDLSEMVYTTAVIGKDVSMETGFQGTSFHGCSFDGNNHKIKNLTINTGGADNSYLGLFGYIDNSSIMNLTLENCNITGGSGSDRVGALVGTSSGRVKNCQVSGSISGGDRLGGLVGYSWYGYIDRCSSTVNVVGGDGSFYAGGLVGLNFSSDNTTGYGYIGNSYAKGNVTGSSCAGGLVGKNYCEIENCYSTGQITGEDSYGGLIGSNNDGIINNSFWNIDTSGITFSEGGTGKTTAQMLDMNTYLNASWDFVSETGNGTQDIWIMQTGNYPQLAWEPLPSQSPSPSNGSTAQSISIDVSWSNGGGATSYNVYFGTNPTPDSAEFKGEQSETTYDAGTLACNTTYYWRIDAKNSTGTTTGAVWSFTTKVTVPDVVGLSQASAELAITSAGFTVETITSAYNNTIPAGNVISQSPVGGSPVAIGTAVDIVISLGQLSIPELSVIPDSRAVNANSGTTTFTVNNTGSGTMSWTASVISGENWLSITSDSSGTNSGTISVGFSANTSGFSRTGTIRVTASGADGTSKDVTVMQSSPGTIDTDNDGLPDDWENQHFGNLATADNTTDTDGDGLLDKDEYTYKTNPNNTDSDGDGDSDGDEVLYGSDPTLITDTLDSHRPDTPVILQVSGDVPLCGQIFDVDGFGDPELLQGDYLSASEWQISTDQNFNQNNIILQRILERRSGAADDAIEHRQLLMPQAVLVKASTYWIRTRHRDSKGLWSLWAVPVAFTTVADNPNDLDNNDIDDACQVPGYTDTNNNGADDSQENIYALYDAEKGNTIGIHADSGVLGSLDAMPSNEIPAELMPEHPMPSGLFSFRIDGLTVDANNPATVDITFYFSEPLPSNTKWYKYDPANYTVSDFTSNLTINGNRAVLTLTDGGPGDDDGVVNGIIVDPSGAAVPSTSEPTTPSNSGGGGGGGGGGGCFIATAAFGSYMEPSVTILRQFRDVYLLPHRLSQLFIETYYRYSPPIADFIAEHNSLRAAVRLGLAPIIGMCWIVLNYGLLFASLIMMLFVTILFGSTVLILRRRKTET